MYYPEGSFSRKVIASHGFTIRLYYTIPTENDYDVKYKYHCETGPAVAYGDLLAWWIMGEYLGNTESGYNQKKFEKYLKLKVFQ